MKKELAFLEKIELTELHAHGGSSISPTMLWEMAHNQGIKLPTKDYWEFEKLVTIREGKPYEEYLKMFDLTELIQSSPEAMFTAMETAVSGAFRKNNITTIELRFNPILRNRRGERDLDHLIVFALQGMERAALKYPVKAGIILMMDRRFTETENEAIVDKAIKYKERGIVGVDLAGPIKRSKNSRAFRPKMIKRLVNKARRVGLGITVHTGEATGPKEMWEVLRELRPNRIGHGVACVKDKAMMRYLSLKGVVLEICPSSNLSTGVIKDYEEMREIFKALKENQVKFTINTDGPEMLQVYLREEYRRLLINKVLTRKDLLEANKVALKASFINL